MNEATANIVDFLNRYELDFGSDPVDAELAGDAEALRERVTHLLVQPPIWVSAEYANLLRASVSTTDWNMAAAEQRQRIAAADTLQAGNEGQGSTLPKADFITP